MPSLSRTRPAITAVVTPTGPNACIGIGLMPVIGLGASDQAAGELRAHRGRKRDAAPVAAQRDQDVLRGLMYMRIMVCGDGKPAIPAVRPGNALELRP